MLADALYIFIEDNLEMARQGIERALHIKMLPHESLYHGGNYYRYDGQNDESIILQVNTDQIDNEPVEKHFAHAKILLYVNATERAAEIEQALTAGSSGFVLARKEEY